MSFFASTETDALFASDMGAEAAMFTPASGPAASCTILIKRPEETSGVGIAGIATFNTQILVRATEISSALLAGVFSGATSLGGLSYKVAEADLDEFGQVWTCHCRPMT